MVKQLTIRGVDEDLHHALRSRAEQQGMSVNRYVLSVLRESVGLSNGGVLREAEFDDLDYLAGTWSKEEYEKFTEQLHEQRGIDEDMWP